jgi:hypothetical protein
MNVTDLKQLSEALGPGSNVTISEFFLRKRDEIWQFGLKLEPFVQKNITTKVFKKIAVSPENRSKRSN